MKIPSVIRSGLQKAWKAITPKRILFSVLTVLLLLMPTFLANLYRQTIDNRSDSFSVSIYQQNGTLIASETGLVESAARYSLLDSFYKIHVNKKEISYAPGDPSSDRYIVAELDLNGNRSTLKCYFSLDGSADYLIDQNNKIYTVPSLYTKHFLSSSSAFSFYDSATPPTLSTIDDDLIKPSKVTWSYTNLDNQFVSVSNPDVEPEQKHFEITGAIGLRFSETPDLCVVSVHDGTRQLYQGNLQGLSRIAVNAGSTLTIKIDATWKQKTTAAYFGTMQYNFTVQIRNRSVFSISSDTVYPGEWILLSGTNILNTDRIRFTADWCPTPTFYQDGDTVYTMLPIPEDSNATSLKFEISYGASAQTFLIALSPKQAVSSSLTASDFTNPSLLSESTQKAYLEHIQNLPANATHIPYFSGIFEAPSTDDFRTGYQHGEVLTLSESLSLRLMGTEFLSADGTAAAVRALNHGIVIQTGSSSALGNYVVVEHGCGLRTWYCHLSRIDVSTGDVVQKGLTLGQSGTGGLSTQNGFLLLCTVNQTLINPAYILGREIRY